MTSTLLNDLVKLLTLEKLEEGLYRGASQDLGSGRVFGGQVLGQAIWAAQQTCDDRSLHSAHAYFLRAGDCSKPIVYTVETTRDGRTYSSRTVTALQNGRPIFTLLCSLQADEEGDFSYVKKIDPTPPSEGFRTVNLENEPAELRRQRSSRNKILPSVPFHVIIADQETDDQNEPEPFWVRTSGKLEDSPDVHRSLLAFVSDFRMLPSTLRAVGYRYRVDETMLATICHAIWFHRPVRMDDWVLQRFEPLSLTNGRGLSRGEIYDSSGQLVASTMQEGVVRKLTA